MNNALNRATSKQNSFWWGLFTLGAVTALVAGLVKIWRNWILKQPSKVMEPFHHIVREGIRGLTEAEAESRRLEGQDNIVSFDPPRLLSDILWENTANIFNFSLLGVASVQFILGLYLEGLLSLGVALLIIGLQVGQELFVRKRLAEVVQAARPQATVIRDGQARSVDPSEIVRGDVLIVGPGDQFMVDGELLSETQIIVNESRVTGGKPRLTKDYGDSVYAGGYCIAGRAAYRAERVGDERLVAKLVANATANEKVLTPMEEIVKRILSVMLIIVAILFSLLLAHYFRLDKTLEVNLDAIVSAAIVIFRLAPAGLFL